MYLSTVTGNDDSRLNRRLQPRRDDDPLYVSKFQTRCGPPCTGRSVETAPLCLHNRAHVPSRAAGT